ncbi:MAG: hypothetical protein IJ206_09370 [Oscillospiraceae bacterium]|nr:hypothetical protein [Oscillospiraceae bacterium]
MDEKMSHGIEWILSFFRNAKILAGMAGADLEEAEGGMQDILHALEFEEWPYHDQAKLAKELKRTRRARRKAKNDLEVLGLITEWATANDKAIKSLEKLLGQVRRTEKLQKNRTYNRRTDAIQRALGEEIERRTQ